MKQETHIKIWYKTSRKRIFGIFRRGDKIRTVMRRGLWSVRVTKSRKLIWGEGGKSTNGEWEISATFSSENLKGRDNVGNLGVDGKHVDINLKEKVWGCWLHSFGSGWGSLVGSCEYCNEPSGSTERICCGHIHTGDSSSFQDNDFVSRKSKFHDSSTVKDNCRTWEPEVSHVVREYEHVSPFQPHDIWTLLPPRTASTFQLIWIFIYLYTVPQINLLHSSFLTTRWHSSALESGGERISGRNFSRTMDSAWCPHSHDITLWISSSGAT
jgi:hypothetical protein